MRSLKRKGQKYANRAKIKEYQISSISKSVLEVAVRVGIIVVKVNVLFLLKSCPAICGTITILNTKFWRNGKRKLVEKMVRISTRRAMKCFTTVFLL